MSPHVRGIDFADCYRKAIDVIRSHPDACDPAFEAVFQKLIDRLEPKADTAAGWLSLRAAFDKLPHSTAAIITCIASSRSITPIPKWWPCRSCCTPA
nr:hypothetical protein [uncultured Rhodopila sp.]